ncbi:Smr/MutS family protein [Nitrosovibrio sp. Nv17]|uniref:Smr/MutS family protein n=1 Tax=Nitrosovibrio sp. Nv17 TaxID=1855339 RepID=UPI0009089925|nr:Smr/MutS family protein [Nitrosovibrio sp. Nv17]SFW22869.1 DNA-nicking endonuclease, Smr domain [Nitrosovibrio sp. Nv17]
MKRRGRKPADGTPPAPSSDDVALFRSAVGEVVPLPDSGRVLHEGEPPLPIPLPGSPEPDALPDDALSDHLPLEMEAGDEWSFLRPGVSRQTLRRLRRGHWRIQAKLDLHGQTRDRARGELVVFLDACGRRGLRCVQLIHGKGLSSPSRAPVLKNLIGGWLAQRGDVLAFCQARPEDGGGGAVLVLLKAAAPT